MTLRPRGVYDEGISAGDDGEKYEFDAQGQLSTETGVDAAELTEMGGVAGKYDCVVGEAKLDRGVPIYTVEPLSSMSGAGEAIDNGASERIPSSGVSGGDIGVATSE